MPGRQATYGTKYGIFGWFTRVLTILVVLLQISSCDTDVVNRVNYGVVFTKETTVGAVYDYWTHTVQMQVPRIRKHQRTIVTCRDITNKTYQSQCMPLGMAYHSVDKTREIYVNSLNESLSQILEMMPKSETPKSQSRSKRTPLGFIGDLSKTLFGTASVKDVKLLASHIEALENKSGKTLDKMAEFTEHLSSFIKISANRYSELQTVIKDNHLAVANLADDITNLENSVSQNNKLSTLMLTLFVEELYHTINLQSGISDFLDGIHDLMRHKLSRHIIPHQDMTQIISDINHRLQYHNTQLMVLPMAIADMYNFIPFVWTYRSSGLYVTIKFPLVLSSLRKFDIYKIIQFPVPLNHSSDHATILSDLPDYIGFSQDNMYYGFPTKDMINGPFLDAQTVNLPLYPLHNPSCIKAIFFDDKASIKNLCDFRVILNSIKPALIHLHHGKYLVLNVTRMYQKCPLGRQQIPGCPFCIYSVPCFCDLMTDEIYFPPRLTHCTKTNGSTTLEHSVNLAMLLHIFELDQINHIAADTKYPQKPLVHTPPMKVFKHNFSEIIAQDKSDDLSLKRITDAVKADKVVFQTLADPILDDLNDLDDDTALLSWNSILTLVNSVVLILLFLGLGYLYYQNRMLATALVLLRNAKPTATQDILTNPNKGIHIMPTTSTTTMSPTLYVTVHDETLLYVLITFACLLVCYIAYKLLTRKSRLAFISVEISSGKSCILIPIIAIPFCPKFYHCQLAANFADIKVLGFLKPTFSWHHGSLTITNMIDKSTLAVPSQVSISILQGLRLRIMLRKTIYCYLVAEHGSHAFHLRLCPVSCTACVVASSAVETPAQNVQPMPLHPVLRSERDEEHL